MFCTYPLIYIFFHHMRWVSIHQPDPWWICDITVKKFSHPCPRRPLRRPSELKSLTQGGVTVVLHVTQGCPSFSASCWQDLLYTYTFLKRMHVNAVSLKIIQQVLCSSGLWITSTTTHLTGPCWNRKQLNREPHPGAKASRHKPPQASKLTNPSLTWKVSSKQPSDVFFLQTPIACTYIRAFDQTVWRPFIFFLTERILFYIIFFGFCFYS